MFFAYSWQADDKALKDKLTEQIAKERAKAAIKAANAEKKRSAETASSSNGTPQSDNLPKRPKHHDAKKRK